MWNLVPKNFQNLLTSVRKILQNGLKRNVFAVYAKCIYSTLGSYKG